jgi:hypothetical protein
VSVPPALSFRSLGYEVIRPFYLVFLALSSSEDKTIVYLVNRMVVDKKVNNKAVKQGVFKQVLLAEKSVMGLNNLLLLKILIASNL